MALNISEKEFQQMLKKNSKLKIASSIGTAVTSSESASPNQAKIKIKEKKQKSSKISLLEDISESNTEIPKAKAAGIKVSEINKLNKNSICSTSVSNEHVSLLFNGAKLLSVNQIFAILQYRKYEIFAYKKIWHEIVKNNLDLLYYELKSQGKTLPYFDSSVEITLFRQASRLVDEDAMSTMFKYIIDGLKRDSKKNPNGILAEDNPKIVHRIVCFSEKGEPFVGIKIKKIEEKKKEFTATDVLVK